MKKVNLHRTGRRGASNFEHTGPLCNNSLQEYTNSPPGILNLYLFTLNVFPDRQIGN
jgi:hypothetical protein